MSTTGADSPIWIVTRNIQRFHRSQHSVIESEIIANPNFPQPILLPFDLHIEASPEQAIVNAPYDMVGITATSGTMFELEVTPHMGSLQIRLEATATWTDANGLKQTAKQVRYITCPS